MNYCSTAEDDVRRAVDLRAAGDFVACVLWKLVNDGGERNNGGDCKRTVSMYSPLACLGGMVAVESAVEQAVELLSPRFLVVEPGVLPSWLRVFD